MLSVNQVCEGLPATHVRPSPPVLVRLTFCGDGLTPTVVVNESDVVSSDMAGGATLIVIGTVTGLPATALPVIGSIALTVTLVVAFVPPGPPVASPITLKDVLLHLPDHCRTWPKAKH